MNKKELENLIEKLDKNTYKAINSMYQIDFVTDGAFQMLTDTVRGKRFYERRDKSALRQTALFISAEQKKLLTECVKLLKEYMQEAYQHEDPRHNKDLQYSEVKRNLLIGLEHCVAKGYQAVASDYLRILTSELFFETSDNFNAKYTVEKIISGYAKRGILTGYEDYRERAVDIINSAVNGVYGKVVASVPLDTWLKTYNNTTETVNDKTYGVEKPIIVEPVKANAFPSDENVKQ